MLVLVTGAKGGVGTTTMALHLARGEKVVALDLADGQLAARLERATWPLADAAILEGARRRQAVNNAVKRRVTLLWTPECAVAPDKAWSFVRAVADRGALIADGSVDPPTDVDDLVDVAVILSVDNPVGRYHQRRLADRYPGAIVVDSPASRREARAAARDVAARIFR
ncbi:MAG: hypothetical protein E3J64_09870 [Anaerolineales bacterium]|nr:MAG: hypothetical protein E3J64_09870 [Anaerolineales bacterium]